MSADRNAKQAKIISISISALMLVWMIVTPFINLAMTKSMLKDEQLQGLASEEYVDTKHEESIDYTDKSIKRLEKSTDDKLDLVLKNQEFMLEWIKSNSKN